MLKQIFDFIRGFLILVIFYIISSIVVKSLHIMLPPAILGLTLLAIGLTAGIIKEEWIKTTSEILIKNMAMFLVPLVGGLVVHKTLLLNNWVTILLVIFLTTTFLIIAIGLFVDYGLKFLEYYKTRKLKHE